MAQTQAHVNYVLTAEFDIDAGPVITHQYPSSINGDHHLMAELMLPDQIHDRNEDWTIFFLYARPDAHRLEYNIEDEIDKEQSEKYYVLSLVNTKFDQSLKRGAQVKAMAIITRHPFFQVFKPLLVLALDDYFARSDIKCLSNLYQSLNALDMSQVPQFTASERQLLASSEFTTLFIEKFTSFLPPNNQQNTNAPTFYIDLKNNNQRLVSRHASLVRDTHVYETTVAYNGMNIPIKVPTYYSRESVGDFSLVRLVSLLTSLTVASSAAAPSSSSSSLSSSSSSNSGFLTHPQLTPYGSTTPPFLILIFALLTQKRVLFMGLNTPSSHVAEYVLACCSLVSGGGAILRSFTAHAFPYTDLSKVDDLLSSNGYIAGVKNPAFERHVSWWDVLVDIENKTIKISPELHLKQTGFGSGFVSFPAFYRGNIGSNGNLGSGGKAGESGGGGGPTNTGAGVPGNFGAVLSGQLCQEDLAFVDELHKMVSNHYGETSVRRMCQQYIRRFVRIAVNYEELKYGATNLWPSPHDPAYRVIPGYGYAWTSEAQKISDLNTYAATIEGWRASRSYKYYIEDQRDLWQRPPKCVIDYEYLLDRLRLQQLSHEESANIYATLASHTQDYDDINGLLSATGSSSNLFYLAMGLFHRDASIRLLTARLLGRIENHSAGKLFFQSINLMQKLAYQRLNDQHRHPPTPLSPQPGVMMSNKDRSPAVSQHSGFAPMDGGYF